MILKQELHCHSCDRYVQFEVDIDQDGNYTIPCPNCGHEHYRVIRNRRITSQRWQSSGGMATINVTWATTSATSMDSGTTYNYGSTGSSWYFNGSTGTSSTSAY